MSDDKTYKVKQDSHHQTHLSNEDYLELYRQFFIIIMMIVIINFDLSLLKMIELKYVILF